MKKAIICIIVNEIYSRGPLTPYELMELLDVPIDILTEFLFELVEMNVLTCDFELLRFSLDFEGYKYLNVFSDNSSEVKLIPYEDAYGFPPINSFADLNNYLKLDHVNPTSYHSFIIWGKRREKVERRYFDKKQRVINAPSKELKKRQRWILDNILSKCPVMDCVHGFVPNKSIKTNAETHLGSIEVGCIDIKEFFNSINASKVNEIYLGLGYSEQISRCLTFLTTYNNQLPQGAPTSPALANLVVKPIDNEILQYAKRNNLKYSRYADDITISGNGLINEHLQYVIEIIEKYGFRINPKKTHVMNMRSGIKITGLSVGASVKVPQNFKRKLRQEIYYCNKYGISNHLRCSNNLDKRYLNYKGYLYGKAYFIYMIEPELGRNYLTQLDMLFD